MIAWSASMPCEEMAVTIESSMAFNVHLFGTWIVEYVFAGVTEGRAKCSVGIIVAERLADCIRSWRCISERCVMIRLRVAGVWMTLVQVYAPTDDRDSETKDGFYSQLQEVVGGSDGRFQCKGWQ